jgi:hypothetical protein
MNYLESIKKEQTLLHNNRHLIQTGYQDTNNFLIIPQDKNRDQTGSLGDLIDNIK